MQAADEDEKALSDLAKQVLAIPRKRRNDSKIGKPKTELGAKASPLKERGRGAGSESLNGFVIGHGAVCGRRAA